MSDTSIHVLNTLERMEEFCSRPDRPSSPLESRAQTKEGMLSCSLWDIAPDQHI